MTWQSAQFISKSEHEAMSAEDRHLLESQPNKWLWEWETEQFFNAEHPDNQEKRLEREAAEARAFFG